MRLPTSAALLIGLVAAGTCRGTVADIWPAQLPPPANRTALAQKADALDGVSGIPPELTPAVRFEKAFLVAVSGAPTQEWLPPMRVLAAAAGDDPVAAGLREVSRAWLARVEMQGIDAMLTRYYAQNVRFPASLGELGTPLPADLRADPWGQPWIYTARAPEGFASETRQRYRLGPTRLPDLGNLRAATTDRKPFAPPAWRVALRVVGPNRALEFQTGGVVVGLISPGGTLGDYSLLYVGDRWALLAAPDQLFTVAF